MLLNIYLPVRSPNLVDCLMMEIVYLVVVMRSHRLQENKTILSQKILSTAERKFVYIN
ncbi:hypothetical protein H6G76_05635 [Nostoc sp. FACHB-152]|uniref:hypothetical protein n=1 Tax=unclassified Nostoc TaxID=2593658 RepID=UPI0016859920|nr:MULTISPECIES: hypothetical protein [unclassified Nostoc]MBD2446654.1 hypothetical protein [Nostoc sp. FACHB-152]MBD2466502.1 hypothetical protein [Nostoc sp. FACHB-145]